MTDGPQPSTTGREPRDDPLASIREHEEEVEETFADRDDEIGAFARISLARIRGEKPDPEDFRLAGLPVPEDLR